MSLLERRILHNIKLVFFFKSLIDYYSKNVKNFYRGLVSWAKPTIRGAAYIFSFHAAYLPCDTRQGYTFQRNYFQKIFKCYVIVLVIANLLHSRCLENRNHIWDLCGSGYLEHKFDIHSGEEKTDISMFKCGHKNNFIHSLEFDTASKYAISLDIWN